MSGEYEFGFQPGDIATASGKFYFCHESRGICTVEEMNLREGYNLRVLLRPIQRKRLHVKDFRRLDFREFIKLGFKIAFTFEETEEESGRTIPNTVLGESAVKCSSSTSTNTTSCYVCGEVFENEPEMEFHRQQEQCFSERNCSVCGFVAKNVHTARAHMRQHTGETPYECMECGQTFRLYGALNGHIRQQHPGEEIRCLVNGTETTKTLAVIECSECGKRFDTLSRLERHSVIHTGAKPYNCDICERGFGQKGDMMKHRRTHTGEKPFPCLDCDKTFGSSGDLTKHRRLVHTKELTPSLTKRLQCPNCPEKFRSNFDMTVHMKRKHVDDTGTPLPPVSPQCEECDMNFPNKYEARMHEIEVHTKKYPYNCDKCPFKCIKFSEFRKHQSVHAYLDPKLKRKSVTDSNMEETDFQE